MAKPLIALFCVVISTCYAASIETNTKCLNLQSNQQLQNLHKECVQYEHVLAPQKLGADTQKQLLCILYLSSYNRACEKGLKIPDGELTLFNISSVCSHREVLVDGIEEVAKLITDRFVCGGVCLDLDKGVVVPECNAAFFLNNLMRSDKEKAAIVAQEKTDVNNDKKLQAVDAAPPQPAVSQQDLQNSEASVVSSKKLDTNGVENEQHPVEQNQQHIPQQVYPPQQPAQQQPHQPQQQESVVDEDVRAEHPAEVSPDKQNNVEGEKPAEVANPPPEKVSQQQAAPPASQAEGGQKVPEEAPKAKNDDVKPVEVPPNNNKIAVPGIQTSDHQKQSHQQTNDHIDSPLLINEESNNAALNDNPEADIKFDDADDDEDDALDDQGEPKFNKPSVEEKVSVPQKPDKTYSSAANTQTTVDGDSYFFSYFMMLCIIIVLFYVGYHNKQKIRAIVLEGPRGRRQHRSRRPNSANYHKLDSNLEEAITSSTANKSSSHVIY